MTGALAVVLLGCVEPVLGWGLAVGLLTKQGLLRMFAKL